jgi:hypothetical protein
MKGAHPMRVVALAAVLVSSACVVAACGGSSNGSPSSTPGASASTTAGDPNAPEIVEPGDIPDDQAFVSFADPSGRFSVKVPEGWARTDANATTTFTDKYNAITIASTPATGAATVESVTQHGLTDVTSDPTFVLQDVQPVTRTGGAGIVARYEIGSAPNPVTGKSALLSVERYVFDHDGVEVVLTLSGAKGADNVDPWKIVTDSLTWT